MKEPSPNAEIISIYRDSINIQLGHAIRRIRKQRDVSFHALTDRTGLSVATVSAIERGKCPLLASQLIYIADVLSVSVPEILTVANIDSISAMLNGVHSQEKI